MSLFPAYSTEKEIQQQPHSTKKNTKDATSEWLENNSFTLPVPENSQIIPEPVNVLSTSSESDESVGSSPKAKRQKKNHKEKKIKNKEEKREKVIVLEFDGNEDFYVDKKPALQYKTIETLYKPACPRYKARYRKPLGSKHLYLQTVGFKDSKVKSKKRYYRQIKNVPNDLEKLNALDENEYTLQLGQLNRKLMQSPTELQPYLDLLHLHERNPYKWSRLLLAEKKIDVITRALVYNPCNETLYRHYIEIVVATYPSYEITKMLDRLLMKDPYNYTLWTAQIMNTQGSMARCNVPAVLQIYSRCMQKMHHAQKQDKLSDEIMLKLFNNCALFLRQAGLNEQFFALIKLAIELNVSTLGFGEFVIQDSDQKTLIEYEELVLQSGLPMNELWLRIEKLRQGFNFLPCPPMMQCSDPQRIVFNEDICHYIYPLKTRENAFQLILLILRLMKLPFVQHDVLAAKFCARVEHIGDSDAIEDILAVCLRRSFALPQKQHDLFINGLYELAREMSVTPTFLNNAIGHEIYIRCLTDMLRNCAAAYAGIDERKRIVFLCLWCRFERLLLILQKCANKLTEEYVKAGRSRFKNILKQPANMKVLNLYTEFAIYQIEALQPTDNLNSVKQIFENIIDAHSTDENLDSDLCYTYVTYAEFLIGNGQQIEALQVLATYVHATDIKQKSNLTHPKILAAVSDIIEKLNNLITIESKVEIMVLEQYLLPDNFVSLLKVRIFLQYLIGQKAEVLSHLEKLLKIFRNDSDRHQFLRENILEIYTTVLQLPNICNAVSNGIISKKLFTALEEYPRNLFILQRCCMLVSMPWYKISAGVMRNNPNLQSIIFLIALARYRFLYTSREQIAPETNLNFGYPMLPCDQQHRETIVRNRILCIFQTLAAQMTSTSTVNITSLKFKENLQKLNALKRNSLFWRFYLRCLSDQTTAFDTTKKCLLAALDESPWSKALYIDGATYVPQELSNLQDLLIEKQLRIYALPEELAILREQ